MAISRKDPKGRKLREGENWRNDGRYSYSYTDVRTGKRLTVYAQDLPELREKEKQIAKDMEYNILTDGAIKKMTLNTLFE
ncbi:integrase DNA-binding domain-containing protein, partial [Blautia schinkii]|uniref:integrase DNA-binding domain-containing protein n=1 Tax=Blautia schinkii TaxID=180164 RepID=UPI0023AE75B2